MTHRAGLLLALVLTAACADRPPGADAIVVAMHNSPATLDPRVGADEASQKGHQLIFNSLFHIDDSLDVAVFQPDLEGVRLSPLADFLFLKDVHRSDAALTAGGAE